MPNLKIHFELVDCPADVAFAIQKGKGSAGVPSFPGRTAGGSQKFELELPINSAGTDVNGPFVQKDSKGTFIYILWGHSAGDLASQIQRRAKIYLNLDAELLNAGTVFARYPGRAKDGLPCCASVKPIEAWHA